MSESRALRQISANTAPSGQSNIRGMKSFPSNTSGFQSTNRNGLANQSASLLLAGLPKNDSGVTVEDRVLYPSGTGASLVIFVLFFLELSRLRTVVVRLCSVYLFCIAIIAE